MKIWLQIAHKTSLRTNHHRLGTFADNSRFGQIQHVHHVALATDLLQNFGSLSLQHRESACQFRLACWWVPDKVLCADLKSESRSHTERIKISLQQFESVNTHLKSQRHGRRSWWAHYMCINSVLNHLVCQKKTSQDHITSRNSYLSISPNMVRKK